MNEFKILGRLNWLKIQYFENGTCMTNIYLGKKLPSSLVARLPANHKQEEEYETFPIVLFNTKNDNVAERIAEECKQGDYIRLNGKLGINTYQGKDGKKYSKIELVAWNFKKVRWDAETNKYVDIEENQQEEAA